MNVWEEETSPQQASSPTPSDDVSYPGIEVVFGFFFFVTALCFAALVVACFLLCNGFRPACWIRRCGTGKALSAVQPAQEDDTSSSSSSEGNSDSGGDGAVRRRTRAKLRPEPPVRLLPVLQAPTAEQHRRQNTRREKKTD